MELSSVGAGGSMLSVSLAAGASPLVQELGICLLVAGFLSAVFERLRIPTIAALLTAGVAIGPLGLEWISSADDVETIANLGLTLLLFVIGIEINPRALLASGRTLLVPGALQVPITVLVAFGMFSALPLLWSELLGGSYTVLYLALATAFSSTLLVVRFLQERRWLDTVAGRLSVGLLIFQDVWAIIVLALQPSFESPQVMPIVLTFTGIGLLVTIAVLGARFLLPSMFHAVAKMPDLVVSVALAWCFLVGLTGGHLGDAIAWLGLDVPISVSMEMGALIAGMTIAGSPYHHEVAAKVANLRDFFVTLFFVALGMSIPMPGSASVVVVAALVALGAIVLRVVVFFPMFYATGLDRSSSLDTALKLAQVSEFSLVITYLGAKAGHVSETVASIVVFAFVITALLTPSLFSQSVSAPLRFGSWLAKLGFKAPADRVSVVTESAHPRLVLLGFHRVGDALLRDVGHQHPEWLPDTVVVDTNVQAHAAIRQLGAQVVYGDIGNLETLRHAHIEHAQLIVCTIPDELLKRTSNEAVVKVVRSIAPQALVFACASRPEAVAALYAAGASYVYMPPVEVANGVMAAAAAALSGQLEDFRRVRDATSGALPGDQSVAGMGA